MELRTKSGFFSSANLKRVDSKPQPPRRSSLDRFIREFDRGLRVLAGVYRSTRPVPGGAAHADLDPAERQEAAALMRVNHAGEVCAQALYQGQALTARDAAARAALEQAAREERTTSPGAARGSGNWTAIPAS